MASRQQPVDRARVERQLVGIAFTRAAIGRNLYPHNVARGRKRHADPGAGSPTMAGSYAARRRQSDAHCVLQRRRLGAYRLDIIGHDHRAANVPILGVMVEQCQRRTYTVPRYQGFEFGLAASWQLSHLLE